MEFRYVHNIESDEPIMLINRHIGWDEEDGMGIDGSLFQEELMQLDAMGKKRIQVWINSVGGLVMDGYNIVSAIQKTKTPVDTYCQGMAASIAGVIFQAGRKRIMADYGILMYHNPYSGDVTDSPLLNSMRESLNTLIRSKCNMTEDQVQRMMDRTSYIMADEAMQMGLCDTVEHSVKLNAKYLPRTNNKEDGKRLYEAANRVLNKIFEQKNHSKMLKVTNKLKLNADANEDSILSAIEAVENRANAAEAAKAQAEQEMQAAKDALTAKEAELADIKNKYEEAKAKVDAAEAAAAAAEEAALAEKAENLVKEAVAAGKVKNDETVKASWKAKAIEDFDGVKNLLDSIAVSKTAAKFEFRGGNKPEQPVYNVGSEMAKLRAKFEGK